MSIEKITSKIISDAEAAAKTISDEAQVRCREILSEAEAEAEAMIKAAEAEGLAEKEKLIARRKSVVEIDGRKRILAAKQELIADCFDKAVQRLCAMEKDEYIRFLAGGIARTGEKDGLLILNEKNRAEIGEALISYLQENFPDLRIALAAETADIRGGFLLKKGSVYINGTIEAQVDEVKEELIGQVAERLFQ